MYPKRWSYEEVTKLSTREKWQSASIKVREEEFKCLHKLCKSKGYVYKFLAPRIALQNRVGFVSNKNDYIVWA